VIIFYVYQGRRVKGHKALFHTLTLFKGHKPSVIDIAHKATYPWFGRKISNFFLKMAIGQDGLLPPKLL
jgi:hypothetical protein